MRQKTVIREATFDPRLKTYNLYMSAFGMLVTLIGIPFLPVWFLGFGKYLTNRQYDAMGCTLTDRSLNIVKGFLFRVEKNVPLDKITDLAMHEGPILRRMGLTMLKVETAGQSAPGPLVNMIGLVDPLAFRDAVLNQRDLVTGADIAPHSGAAPPVEQQESSASTEVLLEIRDCLARIENQLGDRQA